ncbi:Protein ROLLING AND ERECT LEAF 2 [Cardamine amara subsp. amara]|uniref:Protein ROLLING AND ERECT LEAF 2 n=1 Tax=Cardamine amara subsp. amara TaxID=228776 RepID=A0ABD1AMW1_CARAN
MGCGGSKVDDQPLVILCRERKQLIKAASHHRCALAAAHLAYFQSLCDVGESIKRFVDEELVVVGSSSSSSPDSPVLTLPSDQGKFHKHKISSSSSTSISHSVIEDQVEEDQHLHLSSRSEFDSQSESGSDDSLGHIHIESSPKVEQQERLPENFPSGYPLGYQPGYQPGYTPGYQYQPGYPPGYSAGYQYPVEGWGPNQNPYPNPNQNPGMYFMKKSATQSRPVVFQPENHRVENGQWLPENGLGYSSYIPGNPNTGYFGYPEQRRSPPSPVKPTPAPPSPPSVSSWDFLNVFDTYDYNRAGAGVGYSPVTGGVKSNSSSPDSREVREREGIPDLEEETEQEVIGQTFKQTKRKGLEKVKEQRKEKENGNWIERDEIHERKIKKQGDSGEGTSRAVPMVERATESSFGSKTVSSFSSSEEESEFHHVNDGEGKSSSNDLSGHETVATKSVGEVEEEYVRTKGVSFELEENNTTSFDVESSKISSLSALSVHATRDLREVVKEIKSEFEVASSHGKEVAVLLEVSKLPYQQKSPGLKVIFSRIMYRVAPSSASSRFQPQPSVRLTSRILKIAKSYNGQDVREGLTTGNLSSTLEQLYAWEKKLYKEVKDEEKLRVIYEEKCRTLKKLDSLGAESSKIDTTRASIRKLLTKIEVCIKSVDSISSRIHKLRDEELQPQLTQLIHGMWRSMLKCHQKQFHAIMESRVRSLRANTGLQRDSGLKAILDLEMELREWCISFNDWVNNQKSYVESLNGWLSRCLHYEPESTEDGIAPFSPSRVGAPQVFVICKDWQEAMARISGENVSNAMQGFASSLHELWERQDEEQRQRVKAEYVSHDFEKRLNDLRMERAKVRARNDQLQDGASERSVVLSESGISALDDLKVDLDSMRKKLEEERARHKETIKLVNNAASSSLQAGLVPIFEALENFTTQVVKAHEHVRFQQQTQSEG